MKHGTQLADLQITVVLGNSPVFLLGVSSIVFLEAGLNSVLR